MNFNLKKNNKEIWDYLAEKIRLKNRGFFLN